MTRCLIILFFLIPITLTSAQDRSRNDLSALLDSTARDVNSKTISAAYEFDSLDLPEKLDAGRLTALDALDSMAFKKRKTLDSLMRVNPASRIALRTDSIPGLKLPDSRARQMSSLDAMKDHVDARITNIDGASLKERSVNYMDNRQNTDLPEPTSLSKVNEIAMQKTSIPQVTVPDLNGLNPVTLDIPKGSIPEIQIPDVPGMEQISEVQSSADELVKNLGNQSTIDKLSDANLPDVEQLPEKLQEQAVNIDEIGAAKTELGKASELTQVIDEVKGPDAIKTKAKGYVKKQAVDHFAGKEGALKVAMEKVSMLKAKFGEFSSMKDLPKRKPNPMKGKPFVERILPGMTLQLQKSENVLIDVNPLVGYRISGKLTAGFGWNERLAFGKRFRVSGQERAYGPRAYTSFRIGRGYSVKTEAEKMNTHVPPSASMPASVDYQRRVWIWSLFVGLKKDYQFFRSVRGNFQILYNLHEDKNGSPYADRLNMRFGFEFPVKKKLKE